jgi:RNA polymerase sigma factor (sigma-70 family)
VDNSRALHRRIARVRRENALARSPEEGPTTVSVQRYLDALAGDAPADAIVRALLERAVRRLQLLCASLLHKSYPRLARPPLNLDSDELLSTVVERLLKAMRAVKPGTVRQFFALASQHMRWELNDLARRLDDLPTAQRLIDAPAPGTDSVDPTASPRYLRILGAIDELPEKEREVFQLVRIQGLTHAEASEVLEVSTKTVQRRLNLGLLMLADRLNDLTSANPDPRDPRTAS